MSMRLRKNFDFRDVIVNEITRNTPFFRLIAVSALVFLLVGCRDSSLDEPGIPNSMLEVLSLNAHDSSAWAGSNDLFEKPLPERWSPYAWASNAGALRAIAADPDRVKKTSDALLSELQRHAEDRGDYTLVRYDYQYFFGNSPITAPWYSSFGNASVAIGLMHIKEATKRTDLDSLINRYLGGIGEYLSHLDEKGDLWMSEYVSPSLPGGRVDVMNGHFYAVAAMYEWRKRTDDTRYDGQIMDGLAAMKSGLPKMVQDGYFSYAIGHPEIKDYGQQRALNFAVAACSLDKSICPEADRYKTLFNQWNGVALDKDEKKLSHTSGETCAGKDLPCSSVW